jgi:phosphoserine aminotransferase
MSHISFYPGPSRVYSKTTEYIYEAYASGIMFANHRSEHFMDLLKKTKTTLREKLQIPTNYEIAFVSSATECWEIIAQSLVKQEITITYNGDFGRKWAGYTRGILPTLHEEPYLHEDTLPIDRIINHHTEVLGVVHNETSNGTYVNHEVLCQLRQNVNQDTLIAMDATSSMAGIKIDFSQADLWFASVQKCFGLPAGMGIMILSPKAIEKAYELNHNRMYNSLIRVIENTKKNQTHFTPNILGIYLMYRTQLNSKGIEKIDHKITQRFQNWSTLIQELNGLNWLIKNEAVRSPTVLALRAKNIEKTKKAAYEKGLILGNGYGEWKESTFRIANFPAIKGKEIEKLVKFMNRYFA